MTQDQDSLFMQDNGSQGDASSVPSMLASLAPKAPLIDAMSLEGTTLHNLEVIANASDGKISGSLWSKVRVGVDVDVEQLTENRMNTLTLTIFQSFATLKHHTVRVC
jgi:hypothetical protein